MSSTGRKKILIVEDDQELRQMICRFLTYQGFFVQTACHGAEACEALKRDAYDMVITDIVMPQMNGLELLDILSKDYARLQVLTMTGFPSPEIHKQVLEKGAYDCLVKPFPLSLLLTTIGNCFEQSGKGRGGAESCSQH